MRTLTIEEMLSWAFVHELPKGGGVEGLANPHSAWGTICELGTRIQTSGYGGAENFFIEQGEPNADALELGQAVRGLARLDVVIPEDWQPLADWPPLPDAPHLVSEAVAHALAHYWRRPVSTRREAIVALVAGTAVLGRVPDFGADPSNVSMVSRAGRPAWFVRQQRVDERTGETFTMEVEGFNPKSQRPMRGAYRKYELSVDPMGDILGRLDYQIWVAALRWLEAAVGPQLVAHRLVPCDRSMTPWLDRDTGGVALVDLGTHRKRKNVVSAA